MKQLKIVFYPNGNKQSKKTNRIPIYMRISKGNQKTEAKLDVDITLNELKYWNNITNRLEIKGNAVNKRLEDIDDENRALSYILKNEYSLLSPIELKQKLLNLDNNVKNRDILLLAYMDDHFKNIVTPNKNISEGTKRNYSKALRHLKNYLIHVKQERITLYQFSVNPQLAFGLYDYLQSDMELKKDNKVVFKAGIKDYSASDIVKKIKVIMERAIDTDLVERNPFKKLNLKTAYPKRQELQISEVRALTMLNLKDDTRLETFRDMFLFSVFTGLAYSDLQSLSKDDIFYDNGEYVLRSRRNKTEEPFRQILISQAVDLVKKYQKSFPAAINNCIFPKYHVDKVNVGLKIIQAKAQISTNISTHIARHTCQQILSELAINSDVINKMLGWSNRNEGVRLNYSRVTLEKLLHAKKLFQSFLNKNL